MAKRVLGERQPRRESLLNRAFAAWLRILLSHEGSDGELLLCRYFAVTRRKASLVCTMNQVVDRSYPSVGPVDV